MFSRAIQPRRSDRQSYSPVQYVQKSRVASLPATRRCRSSSKTPITSGSPNRFRRIRSPKYCLAKREGPLCGPSLFIFVVIPLEQKVIR